MELFLFYHAKYLLLLCVLYSGKDTVYRAPKHIYSLLLCVVYNGMIIIKQTKCLPWWHNIILFKFQSEFDWMNVYAVGARRKIILKHHKYVTLCIGHFNHLSAIFHQRDQISSFLQMQVFSLYCCFQILLLSRRYLWRSKCTRLQPQNGIVSLGSCQVLSISLCHV